MNVQKTVFISYRRTNVYTARAVYQNITTRGYDCFLDYESIESGSFEQIILNQIAARAHFIVILTPSALERCSEPDDWLRREIEYAVALKRNIIPLMFENFDFRNAHQYLTGKLSLLSQYNALEVPARYFEEAMNRLHKRFLNKPLEMIVHPAPLADQAVVDASQKEVAQHPIVAESQLSAEGWFERGHQKWEIGDYDGAIADCCEAIRLNPQFAEAYSRRGAAYLGKKDYDLAFADSNEAIRLNPQYPNAYNNRGLCFLEKGDLDSAIADYNQAIRINPQFIIAYHNRGVAHDEKGELDYSIVDYSEVIRFDPRDAHAYNRRGIARSKKGDLTSAINDFDEAIGLDSQYADAYISRGISRIQIGDRDGAIADYSEAIRLNFLDHFVYINRGIAYEYKGDLGSANADYQKYIDIGGQEAETVREWISRNEAKLQQPAKRKRSRQNQKSVDSNPNSQIKGEKDT